VRASVQVTHILLGKCVIYRIIGRKEVPAASGEAPERTVRNVRQPTPPSRSGDAVDAIVILLARKAALEDHLKALQRKDE
jgi:hypothetical protein